MAEMRTIYNSARQSADSPSRWACFLFSNNKRSNENGKNDGKLTIKEAFDKLVKRNAHGFIDYSYSDGTDGYLPGRELLKFCDEATAAKLIEAR